VAVIEKSSLTCIRDQISDFVQHLRRIYREQNSYHNFHHALDVLQATYHYLCSAGMVPSVKILLKGDDRMWRPDKAKSKALLSCLSINDIFTLYIAAIGHDVGHPGFTNNFMVCQTPFCFHITFSHFTVEKCQDAAFGGV
jgi:hypothetical protein